MLLCAKVFSVQHFLPLRKHKRLSLWVLACGVQNSWEKLRRTSRGWVRWKLLRRTYLDDMILGEMKSGVWSESVWSVKCGVWILNLALRSVKKVFAWPCAAPGSCMVMFLEEQCNRFAQSTRAQAWLAHGTCKFLRWEKVLGV